MKYLNVGNFFLAPGIVCLLLFTVVTLRRYDALVVKNKELSEALAKARYERDMADATVKPCEKANAWLAEACADGPKYRALIRVYTREACKGSRAPEYHQCLENVRGTFETRYHQGMWRGGM